jgi:hypothetical protein
MLFRLLGVEGHSGRDHCIQPGSIQMGQFSCWFITAALSLQQLTPKAGCPFRLPFAVY